MRSLFSKTKPDNSTGDKAAPVLNNAQVKTELSTPESSEAKGSQNVDEIIDLATDPLFIQIRNESMKKTIYHSEVPIRLILNHLKEFDGDEKAKIADTILKELAGLMRDAPQYKDNCSILRAITHTIKQYGSPHIVKYANKRHAPAIRPSDAKILPSLFEDFENAFLGDSLDPNKNETKNERGSKSNKF